MRQSEEEEKKKVQSAQENLYLRENGKLLEVKLILAKFKDCKRALKRLKMQKKK